LTSSGGLLPIEIASMRMAADPHCQQPIASQGALRNARPN
jgi:hypothetical protein